MVMGAELMKEKGCEVGLPVKYLNVWWPGRPDFTARLN